MRTVSLQDQSLECFKTMILKWQPSGDSYIDIIFVSNYLQLLSKDLRDQLFSALLLHCQYCDEIREKNTVQSGHVAAFIRDSQNPEELVLKFENAAFEFQLLLDICGYKLTNIWSLQLPFYSELSVNQCARMCRLIPNLSKLVLCAVNINDDAMTHLTAYHLELLDLTSTRISDIGIAQLCFGKPNIKRTLRVLNIEDTNVTSYGCSVILKHMPLIEYLDVNSSWLTALPVEMIQTSVLNIQKLSFNTSCDNVENQLEVAVHACPNVCTIDLTINKFSTKILSLLTQFQRLTYLNINDCACKPSRLKSISWWRADTNNCNFLDCMKQAVFYTLRELSLRDIDNIWFKSGRFIAFISACPVIKKLTIKDSDGFDDDIAVTMMDIKLEQLHIENCNELRQTGVNALLKIDSLVECKIHYRCTYIRNYYFNLQTLLNTARGRDISLSIRF